MTSGMDAALTTASDDLVAGLTTLGELSSGQGVLVFAVAESVRTYAYEYQQQTNNGTDSWDASVSAGGGTLVSSAIGAFLQDALTEVLIGAAVAAAPEELIIGGIIFAGLTILNVQSTAAVADVTTNALAQLLQNDSFKSYVENTLGWVAGGQELDAHVTNIVGDDTTVASNTSYTLHAADFVDSGSTSGSGGPGIEADGDQPDTPGGPHVERDDVLTGSGGDDMLNGHGGNNLLIGGAGNDVLIGGDSLYFPFGHNTAYGGDGDDTIGAVDYGYGGAGNDSIGAIIYADGGTGDDVITITGDGATAFGGEGNNVIHATGAGCMVTAGDGNDSIILDKGGATVDAGGGNNSITFGLGSNGFGSAMNAYSGDNHVVAESGDDVVHFYYGDGLTGSPDNNFVDVGDGNNIVEGNHGTFVVTAGSGDDLIATGDGNDVINAGDGNNTVDGGAGNDVITTGSGNDQLDGGDGNDQLNGGAGINVYSFDGNFGQDTVNDGDGQGRIIINELTLGGTAPVTDGIHWTVNGFAMTWSGSQLIIDDGHGDHIDISGFINGDFGVTLNNTGNDILTGTDGNDTLEGGAGADAINGGDGNNTAAYDTSLAGINVNLASGVDTGGDAQGDTLANIENVTGSAFDDTISGDFNSNVLDGGAGDDVISSGGGGNDTLIGGDGNDTLTGGDGNDLLIGGAGADILDGGNGTDTASYAASVAAVSIDLATNINTGGDARGDTISHVEHIVGSAFDDTMVGGSNDIIFEGGRGNDVLVGGVGDDFLQGGNGNDTLAGGIGNDYMIGGGGADTFVVQPGAGTITIADFEGVGTDGDVIQIQPHINGSNIVDFASLQSAISYDANGTAIIHLGAGETIIVPMVTQPLVSGDFVFA
jgi:Ca2+-binding RTX toxin-like protein